MSDFLADMLTKDQKEEYFDLPNEEALQVEEDMWIMYFDRL